MKDQPKRNKPLSDPQIVNAIKSMLEKAEDVGELSARREQALKLYNREQFPNDHLIPSSRSKYVSSDVFEHVEMLASQMLTLFEGQEDVVSFQPRGGEDVELADQQTEIVNWVLRDDNELTTFLDDWIKNGLIYGLGVACAEFYSRKKWKPPHTLTAVPDSQFNSILMDENQDVRGIGDPYELADPEVPELLMQVRDIEVSKGETKAGVRLSVIPPEDVILSADAKFDYQTGGIDAALQGYKVIMPKRQLLEMGYDPDLVAKIPLAEADLDGESAERNRWNDGDDDGTSDVEPEVTVYELFVHLNTDGTDHTPLMHFTLGGESGCKQVLLAKEEVEMAPLAAFVPVKDPNTIHGKGVADLIGKDQRFKSLLYRGLQDNVHQVLNPRRQIREGAVHMDDLLNEEIGATIRTEDPTAITYHTPPFVGQQAFGVIERVNADIESRTSAA